MATKPVKTKWWVKIVVSLAAAILLVCLVSNVFPVKQIGYNESFATFTKHLDERVPALLETYDVPGASLAIVKEGKVVWTKAYGYANVEANKELATDDHMRVESISKSVTAWGVMKLVEEGRIDLDSPISNYLMSSQIREISQYQDITISQLLSHTSGLSAGDLVRYDPNEHKPALDELFVQEATLENEHGIKFLYSNLGYHLLEILIEQVTQREFSEYMSEEVLLPLGMEASSYDWRNEFSQMPKGYSGKAESIEPYVYASKASGGLISTVEDVGLFVTSQMQTYNAGHGVLNDKSITRLRTPVADNLGIYDLVFDAYGYGCFIENLSDGTKAVAHIGQGAGWTSYYHAVPQTGDAIVILTNSQRSLPFISYMLCDWSEWCGLPSLGMERIYTSIIAAWFVIGFMWFICMIQLWRIVEGFVTKTRRFMILNSGLCLEHYSYYRLRQYLQWLYGA